MRVFDESVIRDEFGNFIGFIEFDVDDGYCWFCAADEAEEWGYGTFAEAEKALLNHCMRGVA